MEEDQPAPVMQRVCWYLMYGKILVTSAVPDRVQIGLW